MGNRTGWLLALTIGCLAPAGAGAGAETCNSVSQYGIEFSFSQAVPCGQFANGDSWVVEPSPGGGVEIMAITPAFTGLEHGWEVNPSDSEAQGFDSRITSFEPGRVPTLPYSAAAGESIVKGVSVAAGECRPCLQTAAVLTVLGEVPAGGGANLLRPPYAGADKPLFDVTDLRMDLLPALAATASAPSLTEVADSLTRPWLDHKSGWTGRSLHPADNMPDYGAAIAQVSGDAALVLMLDVPAVDKLAVAIHAVQVGIDLHAAYGIGTRWGPNGGHSSGRKILMALAGVLLEEAAMVAVLAASAPTDFGEDGSVVLGSEADIALWGQPCSEASYWNHWRFGNGSKTCEDPYGHIDGGIDPGASYQTCCNSAPWRAHALTLRLVPTLRCAWPGDRFLEYVDRWVDRGGHAQPDPCAGYDGNPDNYGVTYGPDGGGGCIADSDPSDGVGRFPDNHGINTNSGGYSNAFQGEMWAAYRAGAAGGGCVELFEDDFESGDLSAWSSSVP